MPIREWLEPPLLRRMRFSPAFVQFLNELLEKHVAVERKGAGWQIQGGELRLKKRAILKPERDKLLRVEHNDVSNADSHELPEALKLFR
jgi:hypothetical protein